MAKGQSEIVDTVIAVLFGVVVLITISATAYNLYNTQLSGEVENNLKQIGVGISNNIMKLYDTGKQSKYSPGTNQSAKLSEINLKLPSQVSGRNYEVIFVEANPIWIQISNISISGLSPASVITGPGAKIILRTTQTPKITVEQEIPNVDIPIQGKSENGLNSTLAYYRYSLNGAIKDKILIGSYDIIVDIVSVS